MNSFIKPLADRMRPTTIDEVVGQTHILYQNSLLWQMIQTDTLSSILFYGPPGTGKTTIAHVIAQTTKSKFAELNAVSSGKKDIELICKQAKLDLEQGIKTILFIDEIHRFNKIQQDFLLPYVESGTVILIGATTENPYFEVIPALVSRSVIFELKSIEPDDIRTIIQRALTDAEKGLGSQNLTITDTAMQLIITQSGGDVRHGLSILELASLIAQNNLIDEPQVQQVIQKPHIQYDKDGDKHYDTISAFIKSMRGSDPDATLYYLAKLILVGEDPKFIARRIMVHAAEDVGIADPNCLVVATSASLAAERIGFPEARIILAEAALYVALAPKSNAVCKGIDMAMNYIKHNPTSEVPAHLQDAHYQSASKLGRGVGYQYPHDFQNHWINQRYLPDSVNQNFYQSDYMGYQQSLDQFRCAIMQPKT